MYYRAGLIFLALIIFIFKQIGNERPEPEIAEPEITELDITEELQKYVNGTAVTPSYSYSYPNRNSYLIRKAWDNRDTQLFDHLSEEELRMFDTMLNLRQGQALLAFRQLREMQQDGYPRARVLQRAALFLEHYPAKGSEAAILEALFADREAPEPVLTDEEIYHLFLAFPEITGALDSFHSIHSPEVARFISVFPHERSAGRLLESDEYMDVIERIPVKTFTVIAPGEPLDFEDLYTTIRWPYQIEDAPLAEVLNRIRTGEPVSQQSIAMTLWAYADPARRDVPTLNLLLDALGDLESLIDIDDILHYQTWIAPMVAPVYLLEIVIQSAYYAGRYEVSLEAFERLTMPDDEREGDTSQFIELYLYGAACAAGLGDLERAYNLLEEYLRGASIYDPPQFTQPDFDDFDSISEWKADMMDQTRRIDEYNSNYRNLFHALVWYYLIANEFNAFIDTPYDKSIEDLFATRFELADVDFVARDGRSGPSEELISAYELFAAEEE